MPQDENDNLDDPEQPHEGRTQSPDRAWVRDLEKRAKKADDAEARAAAAEKRLAFVEAGIDTTDPKLAYFVKGYDGEVATEAIRKAAVEAGFIPDPDATAEAAVARDAELAAHDRIAEASRGTTAPAPPDFATKLNEAKTIAEWEQVMLEQGATLGKIQ